jgi:hypothetical protein
MKKQLLLSLVCLSVGSFIHSGEPRWKRLQFEAKGVQASTTTTTTTPPDTTGAVTSVNLSQMVAANPAAARAACINALNRMSGLTGDANQTSAFDAFING